MSDEQSDNVEQLVRQKLSDRIKHRLSLCNRCEGTGVVVNPGDEDLACMDCCDWLSVLKQVEFLEEIASVALDCEPWLEGKTVEKIKWCREQTGLLPNKETP